MVELLVAVAILMAVVAAITPIVRKQLWEGEAAAISRDLNTLRSALYDFRSAIGRFPSRLSDLSTLPAPGTLDLCGRSVPIDWSAAWRGPYIQQTITSAGLPAGTAVVQDTVRRVPPTLAGGTLAEMFLDVTGVDRQVGDLIELSFDGNDDLNAGTVRWSATADGRGRLSLVVPIRGC